MYFGENMECGTEVWAKYIWARFTGGILPLPNDVSGSTLQ